MTSQQLLESNTDGVPLAGEQNVRGIAGTDVFGFEDGLGERQAFCPFHLGMFHRPEDLDAGVLPGRHLTKRSTLAGKVGGFSLGLRLGTCDATGQKHRQGKQNGPAAANAKDFSIPGHLTTAF